MLFVRSMKWVWWREWGWGRSQPKDNPVFTANTNVEKHAAEHQRRALNGVQQVRRNYFLERGSFR